MTVEESRGQAPTPPEDRTSLKEICSLCGRRKGNLYVGGPVRCMCRSCAKIIHKYFELKEIHDEFMRSSKDKIKKYSSESPSGAEPLDKTQKKVQ